MPTFGTPEVQATLVQAMRQLTFDEAPAFWIFVLKTIPPSEFSVIPTAFGLASPEYLNEFTPVTLFGSNVNCTPFLP